MASVVYRRSMAFFEQFVPQKMMPLWKHPAGPQTVFFWSPLFKWPSTKLKCQNPEPLQFNCSQAAEPPTIILVQTSKPSVELYPPDCSNYTELYYSQAGLVIAGIGDLNRPAEKISLPQSTALGATGLIWSRYSLVIIPKNYALFSVNVFVALTALYQVQRGVRYQMSQKKLQEQQSIAA